MTDSSIIENLTTQNDDPPSYKIVTWFEISLHPGGVGQVVGYAVDQSIAYSYARLKSIENHRCTFSVSPTNVLMASDGKFYIPNKLPVVDDRLEEIRRNTFSGAVLLLTAQEKKDLGFS